MLLAWTEEERSEVSTSVCVCGSMEQSRTSGTAGLLGLHTGKANVSPRRCQ